jgi:putative acyl-CoA dehydrogenase
VRQGVAQAIHHATYRRAFGRLLVDAPLMQAVLADLAVESEAATLLALRLAGAVDRSEPAPGNGAAVAGTAAAVAGNAAAGAGDEHELLLRRIGTAVGKYYVCKRGPHLLAEALECLGGNGYVEDSGMPRLYREAPVNSIWEGSGNVNALDVLRALDREPQTADALLAEVDAAAGADARLDAFRAALADDLAAAVRSLRADPAGRDQAERGARRLVERMALALQGSLVVRHSPAAVADAFCASRLAGDWGSTVGTLPGQVDVRAIIDRHAPRG